VNVDDFKDIEVPEGDKLELIFNRQRELMNKYHSVEEANVGHKIPSSADEYGPHCGPLDLQDRASQLQLKSFAWRITEEITEATLCLVSNEVDKTHYQEELIDALHFTVEMLIMSGLDERTPFVKRLTDKVDRLYVLFSLIGEWDSGELDLNNAVDQIELRKLAYNFLEKIGEACNYLKLKPWKTTAMLTDVAAYRSCMKESFVQLIALLKASSFDSDSLVLMYLQKHSVNAFRIRSRY